jgi:uncharacterized protein (TIGR02594 family)
LADFDLSMAVTADGDEAVSELDKVTAAQDRLEKGQKDLDNQAKRSTKTSAEQAAQLKANADAINAVTRATNPAVGSQRLLDAALRKVERSYVDGKVSAELYTRAQEIANRATFATATTSRQAQQGTRQLGLQFNDLGTQVASGISPMVAFTQQAGQMGYAMSQMGGKAGAFGTFIAGGWGALILVGISILGSFISKMGDAKEKTDRMTEAQKLSAMSSEDLTKAILDENKALEKNIQTTNDAANAALQSAQAKEAETVKRREHIKALLEEARAQAAAERGGPAMGSMGVTQMGSIGGALSAEYERLLAENNRQLAEAQRGVRLAQIPILQRQAEARTDKSKAEELEHEKVLGKINEAYAKGASTLDAYNKALAAETSRHKEAADALQKSNRERKGPSLGAQVSGDIGEGILAAARSHLGQTEHNASLQQFLAGQHIDPEKSAWCAAFINAVLSSQGVKGTGSNAASSFLNFGTATNTPQKGDIVVLKSGQSASGMHVGLFDSAANGRVNVTGGNQGGGKVTTSSFAQSSVLAFRRAPTASQAFEEEQRLAEKATKDAETLAKFGEQAATQIGALAVKAMPTGTTQQAAAAVKQLDAIMAEVEKRKPPNLAELRKNAAQARADIQNGIVQPFNEYIKAQQQSVQIESLKAAGLNDEAEAVQQIYRLEEQMGRDLLPEEVRQIYDIVKARSAATKEAQKAQKAQQDYLRDLDQYEDVFRSLFSGNSKDITSFPKRLFDVFKQQAGDKLFESIFGGVFQSARDDATGSSKVKASNQKLAASADKATKAILQMAQAAGQASGAVPGAGGQDELGQAVGQGITDSPLGSIIGKLGKGIGLSDATIGSLTKGLTQGMQGAATGAMVNSVLQPLGKALGFRTSSTGAQIGGAIGSFIPIPGGDIIGSVVGSIIGGLIKGKKQVPKGGVSISDAFGTPTQGGDKNISSAFVSVGSNIQSSLQNIAEQLGGALGAFHVAIGQFDGDIRVNVHGQTGGKSLNRKTPGTFDFNDDMDAAVRFAIQTAISQGAVTGLSAAVQKALKSSPDLDRALQEALKVQNLETALQGVGGELDKQFRAFELEAKDRLRIAKTYGLDIVKTEELNAKERVKVFDEVLKSRIGDLQNFLDQMKFGDLFEGTAVDQRTALQGKIGEVRAQADQGVEGAASQLADLERQLIELSRNAFGTAGPEFAADRGQAQADAERIIAEETKRAQDAQQNAIDQLAAAQTQNALQNETNTHLVHVVGTLTNILSVLDNGGGSRITGANRGGTDLSSLDRYSRVSKVNGAI